MTPAGHRSKQPDTSFKSSGESTSHSSHSLRTGTRRTCPGFFCRITLPPLPSGSARSWGKAHRGKSTGVPAVSPQASRQMNSGPWAAHSAIARTLSRDKSGWAPGQNIQPAPSRSTAFRPIPPSACFREALPLPGDHDDAPQTHQRLRGRRRRSFNQLAGWLGRIDLGKRHISFIPPYRSKTRFCWASTAIKTQRILANTSFDCKKTVL